MIEPPSEPRPAPPRLEDILTLSSNLFYAHTVDHVLTYVSARAPHFFGCRPEDAPQHWTDLLTDHPVNRLGIEITEQALFSGERQPPYELELATLDGRKLRVEVSEAPVVREGRVVGMVGALTDITERRRITEAMLEAARLEAIGRLAGGLAHDFNNLLTVVRGSATLARLDVPPESPVAARLAAIERAAIKAAELTQQLLAFGRRQLLQPRRLDLGRTLSALEPVLLKVLAEDVELHLELGDEPALVFIDPAQLEQVVISLAVHAKDTMPGGGRLVLAVDAHQEPAGDRPGSAAAGSFHRLSVRDNGLGMDEESRARIFEPFVHHAGGTGLGMAMVYGVVRQSGGLVEVESAPGEGTCFRLYFPRAEAEEPSELGPALSPRSAGLGPRARRPVVLVVEDQGEVRRVICDLLAQHRFEVYEAASGLEALALATQLDGRLDLLLTDVVMPGLSGPEVAQRLGGRWPGLSVLFISGYTDQVLGQRGVLEQGVEILAKPFTPEQLLAGVERVFARAAGRASAIPTPETEPCEVG